MKIISWNVNSVRARIENIKNYIKDSAPDILLLQEIKTQNENFPNDEFKNLGYISYVFGQKSYNGVAIISKYKLDNLIVIIDRNDLQITGKTEEVNPIEPIDKKFESFGFETILTNGNNISDLLNVFKKIPMKGGKPTVIIAKTTKGSGVSFIENQINWHHKVPSEDEYGRAISELNEKLNSYE